VLAGVLILVGAVAAGIGLMLLMRRLAGDEPFFRDAGAPGAVFGAVRGPLAVLLAFVIFLAFQGYNGARTAARTEASALLTMSRAANLFPPGNAGFLQRPLVCYGVAVVEDGWPAMERGEVSSTAEEWINESARSINQLSVRTPVQREAITQFFLEANELEAARDDRLSAADGFVPTPVWIVLILGGLMVVGYASFFADRREKALSQVIMIGATVTVIASGLLLVAFFDQPYADRPGSLKPTAMESTLEQLELEQQAKPFAGELPCDSSGRVKSAD
jgi:hypothetical protein